MQFSTNPHQAIKIESFEEFQATTAAVEAARPDHELVPHLRDLGRRHFSLKTGRFTPTVLIDTQVESIDRQGTITRIAHEEKTFASVAYDALQRLSRSSDPHYAPVARFMLDHAVFVDHELHDSQSTGPEIVVQDPIARRS